MASHTLQQEDFSSVFIRELETLATTSSASLRNQLAIRLGQTAHPAVLPVLLRLIKMPDLADARGTLVHCLQFYEINDHFALLIDLVVEGNWEVAHEAHTLLREIDELSGLDVAAAFELLSNCITRADVVEWRKPLLQDLLSMFD